MRCFHPKKINDLLVPCLKCPACLRARATEWTMRIKHEHHMIGSGVFVTFTYRNEDLPLIDKPAFKRFMLNIKKNMTFQSHIHGSCQIQKEFRKDYDKMKEHYKLHHIFRLTDEQWEHIGGIDTNKYSPTLCPRDVQLFIKRLRKDINLKIKYFLCGEYGEERDRPHYHMCILGLPFSILKPVYRGQNKKGHKIYDSLVLEKIWNMGHVQIAPLQPALVRYTVNYMLEMYNNRPYGSYPPFQRTSKNFGLSYLEKYREKILTDGIKEGQILRYYYRKIKEHGHDDGLEMLIHEKAKEKEKHILAQLEQKNITEEKYNADILMQKINNEKNYLLRHLVEVSQKTVQKNPVFYDSMNRPQINPYKMSYDDYLSPPQTELLSSVSREQYIDYKKKYEGRTPPPRPDPDEEKRLIQWLLEVEARVKSSVGGDSRAGGSGAREPPS